jgi:hypothetical protein
VSGLETGSYAFSILLGIWALHRHSHALACAAFLFCALTRFEGAVATLSVAAAYMGSDLLRGRNTWRRHLPWLVLWCVAYGAYFAWRTNYFGYPLPNSVYYKSGSKAGATLLLEFARQTAPLLIAVAIAQWTKLGATGGALAALFCVYVLGSYGVLPSVSYMHRFFLPVYAPGALLACSALARQSRTHPRRWKIVSLVGFVCVVAWDLGNAASGLPKALAQSEDKGSRMVSRARVAANIAASFSPCAVIAVQDVGLIGYVLRNPLIDSFGLNNEAFTHRFARNRHRYADYVLGRKPEGLVLVSSKSDRFVGVYLTDRLVANDPRFAQRYEPLATVASQDEPYHYMIYRSKRMPGVAQRSGASAFAIDERISVSGMVEDLARRAWSLQSAARCPPRMAH